MRTILLRLDNYINSVENIAYRRGYDDGYAKADDEAYQRGYSDGLTKGTENGYKRGYSNGKKKPTEKPCDVCIHCNQGLCVQPKKNPCRNYSLWEMRKESE